MKNIKYIILFLIITILFSCERERSDYIKNTIIGDWSYYDYNSEFWGVDSLYIEMSFSEDKVFFYQTVTGRGRFYYSIYNDSLCFYWNKDSCSYNTKVDIINPDKFIIYDESLNLSYVELPLQITR